MVQLENGRLIFERSKEEYILKRSFIFSINDAFISLSCLKIDNLGLIFL